MKIDTLLSGQKLYWLGIIFIFLAIFALLISSVFSRLNSNDAPDRVHRAIETEISDENEASIFAQLNFQQSHQDFQSSYLDLINKISMTNTEQINIKTGQEIFHDYENAKENYSIVKKRFDDYEKGYKLQCFARMRKLILAVLYYDRKNKKKMTKFDPNALIELGAIDEIPVCPRGGTYSIVYKAGRRLFHCSIHGILKN